MNIDPSMTPEALLDLWRRSAEELPLPHKTGEDVVLNYMVGSNPDYKHASQIPKLELKPKYPKAAAEVVELLVRENLIVNAFRSIADGVAAVCGTAALTPVQWQQVGPVYRNMLCVLFDPLNIHYSETSMRLMTAPVQVTVGPVCVAAVRGFVSILAPRDVYVFDIRHAKRDSQEYTNVPYKEAQGSTTRDKICATVERILQDQRLLKVVTL